MSLTLRESLQLKRIERTLDQLLLIALWFVQRALRKDRKTREAASLGLRLGPNVAKPPNRKGKPDAS